MRAYRPTPVVTIIPRQTPVQQSPRAGAMHGYQTNVNWRGLFEEARKACQGNPWIHRSGGMSGFNLSGCAGCSSRKKCGLGQDDSGMDFSGAFASPTVPDFAPIDVGPAPVWSDPFAGATASPIVPAYTPVDVGPAPTWASTGSGPTGFGLPGTSALPQPSAAPAAPSLITSLTSAATKLVSAVTGKPATPTVAPGTLTIGAPVAAAPSWFTQQSVIAGMPNWLILGGVALVAVVAVGAMGSSGGGRKR